MQQDNTGTSTVITPQYLSKLDRTLLLDLLQHRTRLLLAASNTHLPDKEYIDTVKREVQALQKEIMVRMRIECEGDRLTNSPPPVNPEQ
jgi:hypothetical protein